MTVPVANPRAPFYMRERQTVIYGGTFGPFHNGHAAAVHWLLCQGYYVIVVPSIGHEGKPESMVSYLDRRHMLYLGIAYVFGIVGMHGHPRLDIMTLEERLLVQVGAPVMAIDMLRDVHADMQAMFDGPPVRGLPKFAVGPDIDPSGKRPGTTMWTGYPEIIAEGYGFVEMPPFQAEIHGTDIRRRILAGELWEQLVPSPVAKYIKFRGLYGHSASARQWLPLAA